MTIRVGGDVDRPLEIFFSYAHEDEDLMNDVFQVALAHTQTAQAVPDVFEVLLEDGLEVDHERLVDFGSLAHEGALEPAPRNRHGIRTASPSCDAAARSGACQSG